MVKNYSNWSNRKMSHNCCIGTILKWDYTSLKSYDGSLVG